MMNNALKRKLIYSFIMLSGLLVILFMILMILVYTFIITMKIKLLLYIGVIIFLALWCVSINLIISKSIVCFEMNEGMLVLSFIFGQKQFDVKDVIVIKSTNIIFKVMIKEKNIKRRKLFITFFIESDLQELIENGEEVYDL